MTKNTRQSKHGSKTRSSVHIQGGKIIRHKSGSISGIKVTAKKGKVRKVTTTSTMRNARGNKLRNTKVTSHSKRKTSLHVNRRR